MSTCIRGLASLFLFTSSLSAHASGGKVDICHNTGSGSVVLLNISASAVASHCHAQPTGRCHRARTPAYARLNSYSSRRPPTSRYSVGLPTPGT